MSNPSPQPQWHPITSLPMIANVVEGMLEVAREQYQNLEEVKSRPHVLDDYLIMRIIKAHTQQKDDLSSR